jgi:hypothetical protein
MCAKNQLVPRVTKVNEFYPSRASRREPPVESLWVERLGRTTGSNDHFYKRWSKATP